MNWSKIFLPDVPVLEIVSRGSVVFLALFTLLRVILKRQSSQLGIRDLLVIVLIADASQNAMAGQYHSVGDGLILVATIIFWSFAIDWLEYHIPFFTRILQPAPLLLVKNGRLLRNNLHKELISLEELRGQLRLQGIEDISQVKQALLESDGRISVVRRTESEQPSPKAPDRKRT